MRRPPSAATRRAGARAPPPRSQARVNCRPPRPRSFRPTPNAGGPGLVGWAPQHGRRRSPDPPPLFSAVPPTEGGGESQNKSPARDGNRGRGWGASGDEATGTTRVQPPQAAPGPGALKGSECGPRARELWPRRSSLGLRRGWRAGAGGERARGPERLGRAPVTAAWPPLAGPRSAPRSSHRGTGGIGRGNRRRRAATARERVRVSGGDRWPLFLCSPSFSLTLLLLFFFFFCS